MSSSNKSSSSDHDNHGEKSSSQLTSEPASLEHFSSSSEKEPSNSRSNKESKNESISGSNSNSHSHSNSNFHNGSNSHNGSDLTNPNFRSDEKTNTNSGFESEIKSIPDTDPKVETDSKSGSELDSPQNPNSEEIESNNSKKSKREKLLMMIEREKRKSLKTKQKNARYLKMHQKKKKKLVHLQKRRLGETRAEVMFEMVHPDPKSMYLSQSGFSILFNKYNKDGPDKRCLENFFLQNVYDRWRNVSLSEFENEKFGRARQLLKEFEKSYETATDFSRQGGLEETVQVYSCPSNKSRNFHQKSISGKLDRGVLKMDKKQLGVHSETVTRKLFSSPWGPNLRLYIDIANTRVLYFWNIKTHHMVVVVPTEAKIRRAIVFCFLIFNLSLGKSPLIGQNPKIQFLDHHSIKSDVLPKFDKIKNKQLLALQSSWNKSIMGFEKTIGYTINSENEKENELLILERGLKKYWNQKLVVFRVGVVEKREFPLRGGWLHMDLKRITFGFLNSKKTNADIIFDSNFEIKKVKDDLLLFTISGISTADKQKILKDQKKNNKKRRKNNKVLNIGSIYTPTPKIFTFATRKPRDRDLIIVAVNLFYERKRPIHQNNLSFKTVFLSIQGIIQENNFNIKNSKHIPKKKLIKKINSSHTITNNSTDRENNVKTSTVDVDVDVDVDIDSLNKSDENNTGFSSSKGSKNHDFNDSTESFKYNDSDDRDDNENHNENESESDIDTTTNTETDMNTKTTSTLKIEIEQMSSNESRSENETGRESETESSLSEISSSPFEEDIENSEKGDQDNEQIPFNINETDTKTETESKSEEETSDNISSVNERGFVDVNNNTDKNPSSSLNSGFEALGTFIESD
ncbi:32 kda heat shock protein [Anaeramoeba flamelloides]|uniref:32 kDa heat shock protein n=1 Tax=Anaeramoeba flamelloides TaxID=1746091 RepID=A0AAV7Y8K4_9EUKA|nr:32 kda heat shock protein [Anaeramoeba flamelloides]